MLTYSLRFSLKISYSLYCGVSFIRDFTDSGTTSENLKASFSSTGCSLLLTSAFFKYYGVYACIFYNYSCVYLLSSFTF